MTRVPSLTRTVSIFHFTPVTTVPEKPSARGSMSSSPSIWSGTRPSMVLIEACSPLLRACTCRPHVHQPPLVDDTPHKDVNEAAASRHSPRRVPPRHPGKLRLMTATASRPAGLWEAVDGILERGDVTGLLAHRLGPLAAIRLRRLGLPLPPNSRPRSGRRPSRTWPRSHSSSRSARRATALCFCSRGPRSARCTRAGAGASATSTSSPRSPSPCRSRCSRTASCRASPTSTCQTACTTTWSPSAGRRSRSTSRSSDRVAGAPESPPLEILEAAVPSALQVQGVLAPHPLHHALILSSHAWRREPLHRIRDLLDIAVVSNGLDAGELDRLAAKWGMTKIWSTTTATIEALFYGGRRTVPLRSWARHLEEIRPRTVVENHLQRWVGAFVEAQGPALARLGHELRDDIRPDAGDTWGTKLGRVGRAVVNPRGGGSRFASRLPGRRAAGGHDL